MVDILGLPTELLLVICSICSSADIANICRTCHVLHNNCITELYREIDLSSHNAGHGSDFVNRDWNALDRDIFRKQKLFIRTITEKQNLGRHVRNLRWTVLDTSEGKGWGNREPENSDIEDEEEEREIYQPEDEPMWTSFESLENLTTADLCWLRPYREVTLPRSLFTSAKSIRLSGRMTREFVQTILGGANHHSPLEQRLEHLELNNLLQWPGFTSKIPHYEHLRELATYVQKHESELEVVQDERFMIGILDPLVGRYTALTSLRITTWGDFEEFSPTPAYEEMYASWARFLASVRGTLRGFSFEQGVNRWSFNAQKYYCRGRPKNIHRPMDRLFMTHVLPVLLEAPWPHMKKVEIRGVGRWTKYTAWRSLPTEVDLADPDTKYHVEHLPERDEYIVEVTRIAFTASKREELKGLLGDEVKLVIEEEVERDFEYLWATEDDTGIPALYED